MNKENTNLKIKLEQQQKSIQNNSKYKSIKLSSDQELIELYTNHEEGC
jgi:hypothetical protein